MFARRRSLLGKLREIVNFNPRTHVLAADGVFDADSGFVLPPPIPRHKVYEVDTLECPRCKGAMRVIALIDDKVVIRKF